MDPFAPIQKNTQQNTPSESQEILQPITPSIPQETLQPITPSIPQETLQPNTQIMPEPEQELEPYEDSDNETDVESDYSSLPTMTSPTISKKKTLKKKSKSNTLKNNSNLNKIEHIINKLTKNLTQLKSKFKTYKKMIHKKKSVITKTRRPQNHFEDNFVNNPPPNFDYNENYNEPGINY
jgi:hypothetical protein